MKGLNKYPVFSYDTFIATSIQIAKTNQKSEIRNTNTKLES